MNKSLAKKLCCPMDKHDLDIDIFTETDENEILEAIMNCPQCNRQFPVIYGIPILIPDEYRDKSLEEPILNKWEQLLDEEHTAYSNLQSPTDTTEKQNNQLADSATK